MQADQLSLLRSVHEMPELERCWRAWMRHDLVQARHDGEPADYPLVLWDAALAGDQTLRKVLAARFSVDPVDRHEAGDLPPGWVWTRGPSGEQMGLRSATGRFSVNQCSGMTQPQRKRVLAGLHPTGRPVAESGHCRGCRHSTERFSASYKKCGLDRDQWTSGKGTDIRAGWPACASFEAREHVDADRIETLRGVIEATGVSCSASVSRRAHGRTIFTVTFPVGWVASNRAEALAMQRNPSWTRAQRNAGVGWDERAAIAVAVAAIFPAARCTVDRLEGWQEVSSRTWHGTQRMQWRLNP